LTPLPPVGEEQQLLHSPCSFEFGSHALLLAALFVQPKHQEDGKNHHCRQAGDVQELPAKSIRSSVARSPAKSAAGERRTRAMRDI
jgi:hypothetical protein